MIRVGIAIAVMLCRALNSTINPIKIQKVINFRCSNSLSTDCMVSIGIRSFVLAVRSNSDALSLKYSWRDSKVDVTSNHSVSLFPTNSKN